MAPTTPFEPPTHRSLRRAGAAVRRIVWLTVGAALVAFAGIVLAACYTEGCNIQPVRHDHQVVTFALDASHPVGSSQVAVTLSASALPTYLVDHPPRLTTTIEGADDVSLTIVPDTTRLAAPIVTSKGVADLALDRCTRGQPCDVGFLAVAEWTHPEVGRSVSATVTFDVGVPVPIGQDHCGLPYDATIQVVAGAPVTRSAVSQAGLTERVGSATELLQHVTLRLDDPTGLAVPGSSPVIAHGRLAVAPGPSSPPAPNGPFAIPAMWLRVTPDDGGQPVLDGSVGIRYPSSLPASADFPILADCAPGVPCVRGFWIQAVAFDPTGRTPDDSTFVPYRWHLDASVSYPDGHDPPPAVALSVVADDGVSVGTTPPSLVTRGTGGTFRIDGGHPVTTLAIDATVGPRSAVPEFGDARADATILFQLRSDRVPGASAATPQGGPPTGYLYLSNGHYIGDGTTADDAGDTGAWGGPGRNVSPPGRLLATCAGLASACDARTGLVLHRYTSVFPNDPPPVTTFDVAWDWTVVGAPPDATVRVVALDGETLAADVISRVPTTIGLIAFVLAGLGSVVLIRWAILRRRRITGTDPEG